MRETLNGLHHVTAIAGPAARNVAFYVRTLGLRLVKKTVNFDDPGTYHLYYGDSEGRPGSIFTFFPWTYAAQGHAGSGMVSATAFLVSPGSLDEWADRLTEAGVGAMRFGERFGEPVLQFADPDGLPLELVASEARASGAGTAIDGFHSVTLDVYPAAATLHLLEQVLGFERVTESDERLRLRSSRAGLGGVIDVLRRTEASRGRAGAGTVHHIAFRVDDGEEQSAWREKLQAAGFQVTPVRDRQYFKSIYFREPGGVLFELATDPPGFTLDEPLEALGTSLRLPPWLEPRRRQIEAHLEQLPTPNS